MEDFPEREIPQQQVVEGILGKDPKDFSKLPEGINPNRIDIFLGPDGLYYWHCWAEDMNDKKAAEEYRRARNQWP